MFKSRRVWKYYKVTYANWRLLYLGKLSTMVERERKKVSTIQQAKIIHVNQIKLKEYTENITSDWSEG